MEIKVLSLALAFAFAGVVSGQITSSSSVGNTSTEIPVTDERVDQIIKRANDHFSKGKLNLKDDKREQARDEFDKALDEILMSGLDVRASKRLETFYLVMVEKIYREEVPLIQVSPNSKAKEIAKTQEPKPTQIGLRQQGFDPSPLDVLSKLVLPGSELSQARSQTSYDRFKDITLVWVPYDDLYVGAHHDLRISAFVTYRGKDLTKPEKMGISFESTPHEYSYIAHSELYVLADGERIPLGRPNARDTKSDFKYVHTVTEWLEYWIPFPLMKKIAHATAVEMRLDSFEFNLHPGFLQSMQKLISGIPNPKTAPPPKRPSAARGLEQELRARLSAGEYPGDERFRNFEGSGAALEKTMTVKAIDLNGAPAFIVKIPSGEFCGSGGCDTWLYRKTRGRYVLMLTADEIEPAGTVTNGWRDFKSSHGSGAYEIGTQFYKFDGLRYEPWKCVTRSYDQETKTWKASAYKCPK